MLVLAGGALEPRAAARDRRRDRRRRRARARAPPPLPRAGPVPVQRRRPRSPASLFGVLGIAVTARVPGARRLFGLFAVFLAALLVAFVVPSDLGVERRAAQVHGDPARAARRERSRRSASCSSIPLVARRAASGTSPRSRTPRSAAGADPAHQRGLLAAGDRLPARSTSSPSFRVEAVDTVEHWPAAYLPDAGIPIVRGWYRQNDFPQNELLYDRDARARAPTRRGCARSACATSCSPTRRRTTARAPRRRSIRSGRSGLVRGLPSAHVNIYEVPHAEADRHRRRRRERLLALADAARLLGLDARAATASRCAGRRTGSTSQGCVWRGSDGTRAPAGDRRPGLVRPRVST